MVDLEKAPGEPGRLRGGIPIPISGWTNWRIRKMSVVRGWEVTSDIQGQSHPCVCGSQQLTPSQSNMRRDRKCLLID